MQSSAGALRGGALARSRFDAGGPEVGAAGRVGGRDGADGFCLGFGHLCAEFGWGTA